VASKRISSDLTDLEKQIGYTFKTLALLEQALTHVSAVKGPVTTDSYYERLEFLGDRVLGLAIAEILYRTFPHEDEGVLSRRLATLVRKESCAQVAEAWGVSPFIRLGPGEMQSGLRKKGVLLGDVCEAIIAAIYLDGGYEAARSVVEQGFGAKLHESDAGRRDAKSSLQEWALGRALPVPVYREVKRSGPDHAPLFVIAAEVQGFSQCEAEGPSKRLAEHAAAEAFMTREGIERP
jgi:ribonuclease-3